MLNGLFLLGHLTLRPFHEPRDNFWEGVSLFFLTIISAVLPNLPYPFNYTAQTVLSCLIFIPTLLIAWRAISAKFQVYLTMLRPNLLDLKHLQLLGLNYAPKFNAIRSKYEVRQVNASTLDTAVVPEYASRGADSQVIVTHVSKPVVGQPLELQVCMSG